MYALHTHVLILGLYGGSIFCTSRQLIATDTLLEYKKLIQGFTHMNFCCEC
jgi:hypothetical protein